MTTVVRLGTFKPNLVQAILNNADTQKSWQRITSFVEEVAKKVWLVPFESLTTNQNRGTRIDRK